MAEKTYVMTQAEKEQLEAELEEYKLVRRPEVVERIKIAHTYHIVGAAGADIFSGKISNESPIAQALIGKKVGDKVAIESPAGSYSVEILSVEKTA